MSGTPNLNYRLAESSHMSVVPLITSGPTYGPPHRFSHSVQLMAPLIVVIL